MATLRPTGFQGVGAVAALLAVASLSVLLPAPSSAATKHGSIARSYRHRASHGKRIKKAHRPLSNLGYGSNSTANPTGAATTGAK